MRTFDRFFAQERAKAYEREKGKQLATRGRRR